MVYLSGEYYEGDWEDGKRHGEGVLLYPNGNIYEGTWDSDVKEGKGKFIHASGLVQDGFWVDDIPRCSVMHRTSKLELREG